MNVSFSASRPLFAKNSRIYNSRPKTQNKAADNQNANPQSSNTRQNLKVFAPLVLAAALISGGCGGGGSSSVSSAPVENRYETGDVKPDANGGGIITNEEADTALNQGVKLWNEVIDNCEKGIYYETTDANGFFTAKNDKGQTVRTTDAQGNTYVYKYDNNNRVIIEFTADIDDNVPNVIKYYEYDNAGSLEKTTTIKDNKNDENPFTIEVDDYTNPQKRISY